MGSVRPDIIYDHFYLVACILGIGVFLVLGLREKVPVTISCLMLLASTVCYISISGLIREYIFTRYNEISIIFPHSDQTMGMVGFMIGVILAGRILQVPIRFIQKFPLIFMIIITVAKTGLLLANCIPDQLGMEENYQLLQLSWLEQWSILSSVHLNFPDHKMEVFQLILELSGLASVIFIAVKLRKPGNLKFLVLFVWFTEEYISLFFVNSNSEPFISQRILGMDLLQWAFLLINLLIALYVLAGELNSAVKLPKRKFRSPADYLVFVFYIFLTIISLNLPEILMGTDPFFFLAMFIATTLLLAAYLYSRIRQTLIRYSMVPVILVTGILFVQTRFIHTNVQIIPHISSSDPTKSTRTGLEPPSNYQSIQQLSTSGFIQVKPEYISMDSIKTPLILYSAYTNIHVSVKPVYSGKVSSGERETQTSNGRKPRHYPFR